MVRSSTANRAIDDDAPIVAADVDAARRLLGGIGLLKRVLLVVTAAFTVLVLVPLMESSWQRHGIYALCTDGFAAQHDRLVRGDIPSDVVVHHGHHGTVFYSPTTVALLVNGQVVASSDRCGPAW
jgi:hypothetical protein